MGSSFEHIRNRLLMLAQVLMVPTTKRYGDFTIQLECKFATLKSCGWIGHDRPVFLPSDLTDKSAIFTAVMIVND